MENIETLTSLAMLKVNADEGQDYFEYITPFVSYVLREAQPNPVTDAGTQELLQKEFGLNIPKHAVGFILRRLARRKILKKEHGIFEIVGEFKNGHLSQKRATARRQQSVIVHNLTKFASEEHNLQWDDGTAGQAVVGYLTRFSVDCLRTFTQGCALPEVSSTSDTQIFVVSKFVRHIHDYSADLFDAFVNLVKGHMLANALLCEDLESLQKRFKRVTFYLDTPFLLRLLGFWGKAQREAAEELLDLLQRLDGKLAVFEHTAAEIVGVIEFCEANLENPKVSSHAMITAMRHEKFRVSDLALVKSTLPDFYRKQHIEVRPAPAYLPRFQIDENTLEATIEEEIDYFNPRARENDVNSIRSVYTLREGRRPVRIEDATAVLVTTNTALARAAYVFGKRDEFSNEVSTVITDFSLANIAWLKAPLGAPDLPRLELIADCYATLEPPVGLWTRYVEEIDRLKETGNITATEHELLKLSIKARDELMNLTLGSEEAFSAGTITTILSRVKAELVKEKEIELAEERNARAAESGEFKSQQANLLLELTTLKELTERQTSLQKKNMFWLAHRVGTIVRLFTFVLLVILLISSALVTTLFLPIGTERRLLKLLLFALFGFGFVFAALNGIQGVSAKTLSTSFGNLVEYHLRAVLGSFLSLPPDEPKQIESKNASGTSVRL